MTDQDKAPSEAEREGMRGHDEHGNVRPADGRWDLHKPEDESKVVRHTETPDEAGSETPARSRRATSRKDDR